MLKFKEHGFIYENTFYVYKHIGVVREVNYKFKTYMDFAREVTEYNVGFSIEVDGQLRYICYDKQYKCKPIRYTKTDLFLNRIFHPFSYKLKKRILILKHIESLQQYNEFKETAQTDVPLLKELAETERKQLISKL